MLATNTPLVAVELVAASIWVGSLVCLAVVTAAARRVLDAPSQVTLFRAVGRRYGLVGTASLLVAIGAAWLSSQYAVSTPVNWTDGEDVIISPAVSDDDAKEQFPKGFRTLKPYLRLTPQPNR